MIFFKGITNTGGSKFFLRKKTARGTQTHSEIPEAPEWEFLKQYPLG